jgi:hypothetical protein
VRSATHTTLIECRKNPDILRFQALGLASLVLLVLRSIMGNGSERVCACLGRVLLDPAVLTDVGRLAGDAGRRPNSSGRYQNGDKNDGGVGVVYVLEAGVGRGASEATAASGIVGRLGGGGNVHRICRVGCGSSCFKFVLVRSLSFRLVFTGGASGSGTTLSSTGTASLRKSAESLDLLTTMPAVVRRMCPLRRNGRVWNLRSSGWLAFSSESTGGNRPI